jgi:DNA-binding MarR family transcriptional regulator
MISESPDENDKRAKRVCITPLGISELMETFKVMHKVSEIVIGNLDKSELLNALTIFNKLHYFHQHIQDCDKNASLDELHNKYVVFSYRTSDN